MADEPMSRAALAPSLAVLTLARVVMNGARRFPYIIMTPMATALGVPRSTVETVLSLQWATGAISPFAGPYIDRIGRKRMMLLGMGILAIFSGIAALSQAAGVVLAVIVLAGVGKILFDPAMQAYIGDRTPYRWRAMAIGVTELSWAGSLFIFGPLAAFLIVQVSLNAVFGVLAAGAVIAMILLAVVIPGDVPTAQPAMRRVGFDWRVLWSSRAAMAVLAVAAIASISSESIGIVYEAWMRQSFALDTETLGTLSWVISAAEIAGEFTVILIADRLGKRRLAITSLTLVALVYVIFPMTAGSLPLAAIALFAMYYFFEISVVVQIPLATEVLPQARGTMMSSNVAAFAVGRACGTLLGGWMFRTGGLMLNGTLALFLNLLAAGLIWRFVHEDFHHTQAVETPEAAK